MARRRRLWPALVACLLVGLVAGPAAGAGPSPTRSHGPTVEIVDLGFSAPGRVDVGRITDSGVVVGTFRVGSDEEVQVTGAFRWEDGLAVELEGLGGISTHVSDVNERGVAVGRSATAEGELHAVMWTPDGGLVDLGTPGLRSFAWAINRRGVAVGAAQLDPSDPEVHAVMWRDGVMTVLDDAVGERSVAQLINDRGQVAGTRVDPVTRTSRAVFWHRGTTSVLDLPDGTDAVPRDMTRRGDVLVAARQHGPERDFELVWEQGSEVRELPRTVRDNPPTTPDPVFVARFLTDRGDIVGHLDPSPGQSGQRTHAAVLAKDGTITDLGTLGGILSFVVAADGRNQVVGFATDADEVLHAVLWDDGDIIDLGSEGHDVGPADLAGPRAINRRGQIAGALLGADRHEHAVMWTVDR